MNKSINQSMKCYVQVPSLSQWQVKTLTKTEILDFYEEANNFLHM